MKGYMPRKEKSQRSVAAASYIGKHSSNGSISSAALPNDRSPVAQLKQIIEHSPRLRAQQDLITSIHNSPYMVAQRKKLDSLFGPTLQKKGIDEEEPLQAVADEKELDTVQGRTAEEKEDPLQHKLASNAAPLQPAEETAPRANNTGLPDNLKAGIENLSGLAMDDVKVHYNSSKPAQLQALAYTQGADIHLGPGQEQHLPHEAWHVVQQKQGRVKPMLQMKGVAINDDQGLEREANLMGKSAAGRTRDSIRHRRGSLNFLVSPTKSKVLQAMFYEWNPEGETEDEKYIWHRGPVIPLLWAEKLGVDGKQEKYNDYGVWLRKLSGAYLKQEIAQQPEIRAGYQQIASLAADMQEAKNQFDEKTSILINHQHVQTELVELKKLVERYQEELGRALKKYAAVSIVSLGLVTSATAVAMHFLSLPAVPWGVKAALDISSILYGAYISHRWMTSELLPVLAKAILVAGNTVNWATVLYITITEILQGQAFQSVHIAALPFAITIEVILRNIMNKVKEKMKKDEESRV